MISVGSTVGNYTVVSKLGAGAMAAVFLAEHPRINKRVAIKVIHNELASSPEMVSRFLAEARAASQISHEHIVDILDFGQTPSGDNFMIMEYLDGKTLSARVQAAGRFDVPLALHVAIQIVDALYSAHAKGVIHRDLKPDNIFVIRRAGNNDYIKILDFGLAKLLTGNEGLQHRTSSGSVLGTPHYMAPEQCEGKGNIDGRADLYSVGCMLFYMLTGELPFPGEGFAEVLLKHLADPPPLVRDYNPTVPLSIEKIILHCLAKRREYRFQSAEELLLALRDPEGFSQRIGDDPMAISGPPYSSNTSNEPQPQAKPTGGPLMATVIGGSVPLALKGGPGTGPNLGGTLPIGASAAASVAILPPPPTALPAAFQAEPSQYAASPVLANRAQPEMRTIVGDVSMGALGAIAALNQGAQPPPSDPPPMQAGPPSTTPPAQPVIGAPPLLAGQTVVSGAYPAAPSSTPGALPVPGGQVVLQQSTGSFPAPSGASRRDGGSIPGIPVPSAGPGLSSSNSFTPVRPSSTSQPVFTGPPPGASQPNLNPGMRMSQQALPTSRPAGGALANWREHPLVLAFSALPPDKRRLAVLGGAGAGLLFVLSIILLLLPSRVTLVIRSDPDDAQVLRDGENIGKTPLAIEVKKGAPPIELVLRKDGFEDTTQAVSSKSGRLVVVSLKERADEAVEVKPDPAGGTDPGGKVVKPPPDKGGGGDEGNEPGGKPKRKKPKKKPVVF